MLKKHKTSLFNTMALISFFLVLGSVGAMERNTVSLLQGTIQAIFFLASTALFAKLAGKLEKKVK